MEEKVGQENEKKSGGRKNDQLGEDLLGSWAKFRQNRLESEELNDDKPSKILVYM